MNQILQCDFKHKKINSKNKKFFFKIQFFISIILLFIIMLIYIINLTTINSEETASKQITENYNILKLYSNTQKSKEIIYSQDGKSFSIIGMIEIPKINIYYPIISESNENLLKIAPCRISGPMPNEDGNLCIAGHNYDNYKFFSKVNILTKNDKIIIYNVDGSNLIYKIDNIYETSEKNLSPLENLNGIKKQVTLITCNNFNSSSRIIITAFNK